MRFNALVLTIVLLLITVVSVPLARGCVGKVLHIGVIGAPEEQLLAEMISQLITERTGTTVKISLYKDSRQIYAAVRKGEVGLFIENPDAAMTLLGRPREANRKNELETARQEYRKTYNLVWLDPVPGGAYLSPVLSTEVLSHLPALPRLINKLPVALTGDALQRLVKSVRADEPSRKVAREFLKSKKLI